MCSKFTGDHPCRTPMLCNFIEIVLLHGCSPVNLLYIFRMPLPKHLWVAASHFCNINIKVNEILLKEISFKGQNILHLVSGKNT